MTCTFFGHRDTPDKVEAQLKAVLVELIENEKADLFLVGNNGRFDAMVYRLLRTLSEQYKIKYYVVSAYINEKNHYENLIVADGCETVPPRFAILYRNKWMLRRADTVITFVEHPSSGAGKLKALAEKQGKRVINIST